MPFAPRPRFLWQLRTRTLLLGERTLLMAILNLTPDSFSDGNTYPHPLDALTHALELLDAGVDILDLGAESTRPGATPIPPAEEQQRLLPILEAIHRARPEAILSVDTFHAETALLALLAGAEIINDVSGLAWDPAMSATLAQHRPGVVLMHTRGTSQQWRTQPPLAPETIAPLVLGGLRSTLQTAQNAGISRETIVLDPGFGFGKIGPENYPLLAHLDQFHTLNRPLLAGTSRKGFLAQTVAQTLHLPTPPAPTERLYPTIAANTAAILAGAHILRIHDLRPAQETAAIADALLNSL